MNHLRGRTLGLMVSGLMLGLLGATPLFGEEAMTTLETGSVFDPTQTYEVFFSLHPGEIDRLSNVRLLGMSGLGAKTYLKFQVWLNNQREEGWIDLQTVSAILPSPRPLANAPEILLDRQPSLDQEKEKVKEIRTETVREVIREVPPGSSPRP